MSGELARKRTELELRIMSETATEKSWHIPAQAGKGPVTVALRIPEVRVTDSAGRHILIGPEQAGARFEAEQHQRLATRRRPRLDRPRRLATEANGPLTPVDETNGPFAQLPKPMPRLSRRVTPPATKGSARSSPGSGPGDVGRSARSVQYTAI